jgi:hypothetical protein
MTNTFEIGKTYRTVVGRTMKFDRYLGRSGRFVCEEQNDSIGDRHSIVYLPSGKADGDGWSGFDLLPGAIEDEEAPGRVPAHERIDELFKLIRIQGECIEVQDNAIGIIDKRIETLTAELSAAMTAGKGQYVELARQMQGIRAKLTEQSDRFDQHQSDMVKNFVASDKLCENIRLVADGAHIRLDVLRDDIAGLKKWQAHIEKHLSSPRIDNRFEQLDSEVAFLARYLGFEVADGNFVKIDGKPVRPIMTVTQTPPNMAAEPKPMTPFKRTIKGGWMNVYAASPEQKRDLGWRYHFATRELADKFAGPLRTACIQIPDFTEGEGL